LESIPISNFYTGSRRQLNSICQDSMKIKSEWKSHKVSHWSKNLEIGVRAFSIAVRSVTFVVIGILETLSIPVFYPIKSYYFKKQMENDIKEIPKDQRTLITHKIERIIEENKIILTETEKKQYIKSGLATYSTTKAYYSPVVYEWTENLMRSASIEGRTLVFLARDGIAPYNVAQIIKENNPEFKDVPIHLKYLSRKVVNFGTNPTPEDTFDERNALLKEYLYQDTELSKESKTLFVDVGFAGSMIEPIRELMLQLKEGEDLNLYYTNLFGHPPDPTLSIEELIKEIKEEQFKFSFLVSHTTKASGFLGNSSIPLESLRSAGQNPAVHFLEDTHQGVVNSPKSLVRLEDGTIVPNVLEDQANPKDCKKEYPKEFLIKSVATVAIEEYARGNRLLDAYKDKEEKLPQFILKKIRERKTPYDAELCYSLFIEYVNEKGVENCSIKELKDCYWGVVQRVKESYKGNKISKEKMKRIAIQLKPIVNEVNRRKSTRHIPFEMATENMRDIFDNYLSDLYYGRRYLYLEHR
jgi:hypothetical protein